MTATLLSPLPVNLKCVRYSFYLHVHDVACSIYLPSQSNKLYRNLPFRYRVVPAVGNRYRDVHCV